MDPDPSSAPMESVRKIEAGAARTELTEAKPAISSNREIAIVQADYLALANDLEQAQALASALGMELSGKSNELARFKLIWERTQGDLAKFEQDIDALRKERHVLANEAQLARAFESRCERVQAACDELAQKNESLQAELTREREAHVKTRAQLHTLLQNAGVPAERLLRKTLEELGEQIDRALAKSGAPRPVQEPEHIDIEFSP